MHFFTLYMSKYSSPFHFFNIQHMPLVGKWQTILKVTLNSKLYKTYSHLKVIFCLFYLITSDFLHINILYLLYNSVQFIYMQWNYLAYVDRGYRLRQRSCLIRKQLFYVSCKLKLIYNIYEPRKMLCKTSIDIHWSFSGMIWSIRFSHLIT